MHKRKAKGKAQITQAAEKGRRDLCPAFAVLGIPFIIIYNTQILRSGNLIQIRLSHQNCLDKC